MKNSVAAFEQQNSELITLFDEFLRKRPDLLDEIPDNAVLVMQLEGDKAFNEWAYQIAHANAGNRPMVLVTFALKSRRKPLSLKGIERLELSPVV
ncbi:MAG: DUF5647 family protein [Candidatus Bipolaricaulia bacterium]